MLEAVSPPFWGRTGSAGNCPHEPQPFALCRTPSLNAVRPQCDPWLQRQPAGPILTDGHSFFKPSVLLHVREELTTYRHAWAQRQQCCAIARVWPVVVVVVVVVGSRYKISPVLVSRDFSQTHDSHPTHGPCVHSDNKQSLTHITCPFGSLIGSPRCPLTRGHPSWRDRPPRRVSGRQ